MTQGPFLYDDGPAPLHTGTPRRRQGWLIAGILGVALLAGGMVAGLYLVRGSPADQSTEVTQVFLAALAAGDTETSYQLLCAEERQRLDVTGMEAEYLRPGSAEVAEVQADPVEGATIQQVTVRWEDGASAELAVVNEDGPRICGIG
ncbi:Rv0361 family membrane protein [Blastococcus sp. SYSU DS0619]